MYSTTMSLQMLTAVRVRMICGYHHLYLSHRAGIADSVHDTEGGREGGVVVVKTLPKFGSYSVMDLETAKIVDVQLVQVSLYSIVSCVDDRFDN